MGITSRKFWNSSTMLWIVSLILIITIVYHFLDCFNIIEGGTDGPNSTAEPGSTPPPTPDPSITNLSTTTLVKIQALPANEAWPEWLNIHEVTLYDSDPANPGAKKIPYTATCSNGIYGGWWWWVGTQKLYDGDDNTMFHSGNVGATLTLFCTDAKVKAIRIVNRKDCCDWRLGRYKLLVTTPSRTEEKPVFSFNLIDAPGIYAGGGTNFTHTFTNIGDY